MFGVFSISYSACELLSSEFNVDVASFEVNHGNLSASWCSSVFCHLWLSLFISLFAIFVWECFYSISAIDCMLQVVLISCESFGHLGFYRSTYTITQDTHKRIENRTRCGTNWRMMLVLHELVLWKKLLIGKLINYLSFL